MKKKLDRNDKSTIQLQTAVWLQRNLGRTDRELVRALVNYNGEWLLPWSVIRLRAFRKYNYPYSLPINPGIMKRELEAELGRGNVRVRPRGGTTSIYVRAPW